MASDSIIHVLNLGTQAVTLAEFARGPADSLLLKRYARQEILADPATDATRLPQIRLAISEVKDELKLKAGTAVIYALSGHTLFTRFVKIPSVAPEKVAEIAGFEAQQNVPFPIDEVIWDYQLVADSKGAADQIELVLVAAKADALEELHEAIVDAGFRPRQVDAAPMALYNAFRYTHGVRSECVLLVDIGSRNTNLIFIEGGRIFARSVPFGGSKVTEALAKEFSESFAAAENRKKSGCYIGLGGAYAEDRNPEIAKAAKVTRNAMTRLHSEIVRNVNSYRAQQGGAAPSRLVLCGGGANLGYTREFFAEKFGQPIEFFNPLQNVAITATVNAELASREAHLLGEVTGLALRAVTHCPMELNLPPASLVAARRGARRQGPLVLAAICFLLTLAAWWLLLQRSGTVKEAALEPLTARVTQMQGYENAIKQTRTEITALQQRAAPLLAVVQDREFWPKLIAEVNARLPESFLWVTLMEPTQGGRILGFTDPARLTSTGVATAQETETPAPTPAAGARKPAERGPAIDGIRVRGLYLVNPNQDRVIVDFVQNLAKSPLFDLDLNNQAAIIVKKSPQNEREWAFDYELQLKLKSPLPLP